MIRAGQPLSDLEARDQREAHSALTYTEALGRFEALWSEARALNPDIGRDWREDLVADLAIARAINGCAPAA
jgi:hypothetical protein